MPELTECPQSGPAFLSVLRLSKLARATVGFLPDSAFRDRAARGTLLVGETDEGVIGYVLYDLPRDVVRIVQLVTDPSHQGQGIARALVEELVQRHPGRRGIMLECRRDFAVSKMWPRLHFAPIGERPGRSRDRRPLTVWFRDFGHPTLFSVRQDDASLPIAALDANIVIDLADGAVETSEPLMAEWMRYAVQLAVTDEILLEFDRQEDQGIRTRHRRYASSLSRLHAEPERWVPLLEAFTSEIPNPGRFRADLRHAARAAAGDARWLVTRDDRFRRACAATIKAIADLEVVSPGGLLLAVDALVRDDTYRPVDLDGSSLELRDLVPSEFDTVAIAFVNQREGEPLSRLRRELDRLAVGVPRQRLRVLVEEGSYIGLVAWCEDTILDVSICRVRRGESQSTIARQLVGAARVEAAALGAAAVRLNDAHCGEWVRRAATDEGYLAAGAGFTAFPLAGIGSRNDLVRRVELAVSQLPPTAVPLGVADVVRSDGAILASEDLFHPWRFSADDIPTFVLSIEAAWAAELFDVDIARSSLFPRRRTLVLQREHVYYRSPAATGGLTAPARVLWYVKASPASRPGLRAISTLRDVVVGDAHRLYRRFSHLGAYDRAQVLSVARQGQVMALRFSHTSMLPRPISLNEYRAAMQRAGRGINLQGPQRLPERVFADLATLLS